MWNLDYLNTAQTEQYLTLKYTFPDEDSFRRALKSGKYDREVIFIAAAYRNYIDIVKEMVEKNVNYRCFNDTPLHKAVDNRSRETVEYLLQLGCLEKMELQELKRVLVSAVKSGSSEILEIILPKVAALLDENGKKEIYNKSPLFGLAFGQEKKEELVECLLRHGLVPGRAHLLAAATNGNYEMLKWLVKRGINPLCREISPLYIAVCGFANLSYQDGPKKYRRLSENSAVEEARDKLKTSYLEIIKFVFRMGANLYQVPREKLNELLSKTCYDPEMQAYILSQGADSSKLRTLPREINSLHFHLEAREETLQLMEKYHPHSHLLLTRRFFARSARKIELLLTDLYYRPGSPGYRKAEESFKQKRYIKS